MEIKGKIIHVLPLITGQSAKGEWKKQDYVLETEAQYPKKVCFNIWGDKIDLFNIQLGDDLVVSIDIESREYNGRWYTEIRAWKVDRATAAEPNNSNVAPFPSADYFSPEPAQANSTDDLPF